MLSVEGPHRPLLCRCHTLHHPWLPDLPSSLYLPIVAESTSDNTLVGGLDGRSTDTMVDASLLAPSRRWADRGREGSRPGQSRARIPKRPGRLERPCDSRELVSKGRRPRSCRRYVRRLVSSGPLSDHGAPGPFVSCDLASPSKRPSSEPHRRTFLSVSLLFFDGQQEGSHLVGRPQMVNPL